VRELLAEKIRHRAAAFLVRLRDLRAVRRPRVPGDRDAARAVVGEQLEEHVREAEERVRRLPVGGLQLLGQREVGAVGEIVAVHEEKVGSLDRPVVELQLLAGQRLRHGSSVTQRGGNHVSPADPLLQRCARTHRILASRPAEPAFGRDGKRTGRCNRPDSEGYRTGR
jgi:hypothetical protein